MRFDTISVRAVHSALHCTATTPVCSPAADRMLSLSFMLVRCSRHRIRTVPALQIQTRTRIDARDFGSNPSELCDRVRRSNVSV